MRGGRLAVAAGALALLGAPAAPLRAAATPTLTITGPRTGWAEVRLTAPATFTRGAFTSTTDGGYAGFALWRDGTVVVADVRVAGWQSTVHVTRQRTRDVVLAPGRYRLYLVADGRASVTVRLSGKTASRSVRVRTPVAATGTLLDLGEPITSTKRIPLPHGNRTFALLAMRYYADAAVAIRAGACFRESATDDCADDDFTGAKLNALGWVGTTAVGWPGTLPADGGYGVFRADGVAFGAQVTGYYVAFDAAI